MLRVPPEDFDARLDRFALGIIRRKVDQMIGRHGFRKQDRESLQQELITRLLRSLPSFDPAKSHRNVFVTTVVERSVANIIRHQRTGKRAQGKIDSLNECDDEGVELIANIGQDEYDARRCHTPRSDEDASQLKCDVHDVIAKLPDDLRELAELLKKKSLSEISRELGIPRSTLQIKLERLRAKFEAANISNYL